MSSENQEFETAEAGASLTTPIQAGALRKGAFVMIKGFPCKIVEITTSKTGKHGHAKAHIVALDIFTNKKMEDLCPCSHNTSQPVVVRTEYTLLDVGSDGEVSLLTDNGDTKDDLNIDTQNTDHKHDQLQKLFDEGKSVIVTVLAACGKECIIDCREATN